MVGNLAYLQLQKEKPTIVQAGNCNKVINLNFRECQNCLQDIQTVFVSNHNRDISIPFVLPYSNSQHSIHSSVFVFGLVPTILNILVFVNCQLDISVSAELHASKSAHVKRTIQTTGGAELLCVLVKFIQVRLNEDNDADGVFYRRKK